VTEFQKALIEKKGPVFYALDSARVVGWCDIFPESNPRLCHRGHLGMGLLAPYRGKGIGGRLLAATLDQARVFGFEKVELTVYTTNTAAIALYRRLGFLEEGLSKHYRKVDGRYFDALRMAKFL
jgi:RimJ/RimL family protein N-acetyltransferase